MERREIKWKRTGNGRKCRQKYFLTETKKKRKGTTILSNGGSLILIKVEQKVTAPVFLTCNPV